MNIFSNKTNLFLLGIIIVTSHSHAMQHIAAQYPVLAPLYHQPVPNQFIFANNEIFDSEAFKQDTELVEKAKKQITENHGATVPEIILKLTDAASRYHPEAEFLLGDEKLASRHGLQMYRLIKGQAALGTLFELIFKHPEFAGKLLNKSEAYQWFADIVKHPLFQESEQSFIRGQAEYAIGYMCLHCLGIPEEEAKPECARKHFEKALSFQHPYAQKALDQINLHFGQRQAPSQSAPALSNETMQQTKVPVATVSKPIFRVTKNPGTPSADVKMQQQTPVTAQAATVSALVAITQSPVSENIPQSKPVQVKQDQPEKVQQKSEQKKVKKSKKTTQAPDRVEKPTEAVFTISEDISLQVQECQPEADSAPSKSKKTSSKAQQKKPVKPSKKPSKAAKSTAIATEPITPAAKQEKQAKESKVKATAQAETMADQVSQTPQQVADKKEEPAPKASCTKKEQKQKQQEKGKSKQPGKAATVATPEKEKADCAQAYKIVTNLTSRYLNAADAAKNKTDMCMESANWKTAQAVYRGANNLLLLLNRGLESHPELRAILLYIRGYWQEANKAMPDCHQKTSDSVLNWYKALILFKTEPSSELRNQSILSLADDVLFVSITNYQTLRGLLQSSDEFVKFIEDQVGNNTAGKTRSLRMKLLFGGEALERSTEDALLNAHAQELLIDASIILAEMYTYGIFGKQSFGKALSILESAIKFEKKPNNVLMTLLRKLAAFAAENRDWHSYIHALYLDIIEHSKMPGCENEILIMHENAETKLKSMKKPLQKAAAKLLIDSGAYEALLKIAENNVPVALSLDLSAQYRVTNCGFAKEAFAKSFKSAETFSDGHEVLLTMAKGCGQIASALDLMVPGFNERHKAEQQDSYNMDVDNLQLLVTAQLNMFQKSLAEALSNMKKAINNEKKANRAIMGILQDLREIARKDGDTYSQLYSMYLLIVEMIKAPEPEKISAALKETEELFNSITEPEQAAKAANLLTESGAFEALVPIAKTSDGVKSQLLAIVATRKTKFGHSATSYTTLDDCQTEAR